MQIDQIIIRPAQKKFVVQYSDEANRPNKLVVDATNNANVAALVADATLRLPTPQNRPDKPQIEKEIAGLEARLVNLRKSIGQA